MSKFKSPALDGTWTKNPYAWPIYCLLKTAEEYYQKINPLNFNFGTLVGRNDDLCIWSKLQCRTFHLKLTSHYILVR